MKQSLISSARQQCNKFTRFPSLKVKKKKNTWLVWTTLVTTQKLYQKRKEKKNKHIHNETSLVSIVSDIIYL